MIDNIQNTIQERMSQLPQSVRSAISHINYQTQVASLMHKYGLRVDQAGIIDTEIMLVLLGLEHPDSLAQNLVREGHIQKETAEAIMRDINENIFKQIRHELVELYSKEQILSKILNGDSVEAEKKPQQSTPTRPATAPQNTQPQQPAAQRPHGVEHTMPGDIAKTKLEQSFRMPPQNTTVNLGNQTKQAPASGADPYREPTA